MASSSSSSSSSAAAASSSRQVVADEGQRMTQLRKVFRKALDKTFQGVDLQKIPEFFDKSVSENKEAVLKDYTVQVMTKVRDNVEDEFDMICREAQIATHLNRLDELCNKQPAFADGTRVPPFPSLTPQQSIHDRVISLKLEEKKRLAAQLKAMEEENAGLRAKLMPKRQQVRELAAAVKEHAAMLEAAVGALEPWAQQQSSK